MKIKIPSSELGRNERYGQEQSRVIRIRGVIVFGAGPYLCATRVWMSEYKVQRCSEYSQKSVTTYYHDHDHGHDIESGYISMLEILH